MDKRWPWWVMAPVIGVRKAQLIRIMDAADRGASHEHLTKKQLIERIMSARQAFRDSPVHPPKPHRGAKRPAGSGSGLISADECNAFLRSLHRPEVPE